MGSGPFSEVKRDSASPFAIILILFDFAKLTLRRLRSLDNINKSRSFFSVLLEFVSISTSPDYQDDMGHP